jgi:hypothetical protein
LKSAFMKLQKSKNVNRVLLNRFVEKIAWHGLKKVL